MKILTFDTSTDTMYTTLGQNERVDAFRIVKNTKNQYNSAFLIPVIIELLKEQELTMQDIDAIGVNIGPGSFTGIRVSATVARIMGQNLDIPVIGISSLEIYSLLNCSDKDSVCVLDAKKGKAYIGVYSSTGEEILKPQALDYEKIIEYIKEKDVFVIADSIMSDKFKLADIECLNLSDIQCDYGIYLAKLTNKYLNQNKDENKYRWFNLKPLYIQPPPITMPKPR